ncbi:hypothetical protein DVH02_16205 [Streptomyces corynorhini]|uniref:UL36 very large tegument protein n=1 Tax=Streptomyces corynorhini TaxID=2282652 RepID=A0A370B5N6_9ACTN|nr:hypothetical protein DVH02_16205 [Streptomyces corynorhini]
MHQLPAEIGNFAQYLQGLAARLDPSAGWYGVFGHRDPEGLRACFDGAQVPPWDVVDSLLQDFAAGHDQRLVARESERARRLHAASAAAYDRLPGGAEALAERLRLMLREQTYAAGRADELARLLRGLPRDSSQGERLGHDLAWVRDDHARATARCAELRTRLSALTAPGSAAPPRPPAPGGWFRAEPGRAEPASAEPASAEPGPAEPGPEDGEPTGAAGRGGPADAASPSGRGGEGGTGGGGDRVDQDGTGGKRPDGRGGKKTRKEKRPATQRKPRGARFAGIEVEESEPAGPAPVPLAPPPGAPATPRGARFGGVPEARPVGPTPPALTPEDRRAAAETVERLIRLRAEGRSGEAHVVLCEAAGRPPGQLPQLAAELHRAGLGADWAELLWEAAFLPPARLAAAAGALALAGRDDDCHQLLRQGVSRPAGEISDAVLALGDAGREQEARALLTAFVQARAPEDAALVAAPDPGRLVPQLIEAARTVSVARERDLVHALRVAGIGHV